MRGSLSLLFVAISFSFKARLPLTVHRIANFKSNNTPSKQNLSKAHIDEFFKHKVSVKWIFEFSPRSYKSLTNHGFYSFHESMDGL